MRLRRALFIGQLLTLTPAAVAQTWVESFDDIHNMPDWVFANRSSPLGPGGWHQGDIEAFPPYLGTGYLATDFTCGAGLATLSDWMIGPARVFYSGDSFTFKTRTLVFPATYPDRLQVRFSPAGTSTNVGSSATDVGDFTMLLVDINPTYSHSDGFYDFWGSVATITVTNIPAEGVVGRLAFRYFVENGGPLGVNSTMIGIDNFSFSSDGPPGACCLASGFCQQLTARACLSAGGVYVGGAVPCGSGGATCPVPVYVESGDAGDVPSRATVISGPSGTPLPAIGGHFDLSNNDRADMYRITICDLAAFRATAPNTTMYLFDLAGIGIVRSRPVSGLPTIDNTLIPSAGDYYLACTHSGSIYRPVDSSFNFIWPTSSQSPSGIAAGNPVNSWLGVQGIDAYYQITLSGLCQVSTSCVANCDESTSPPILNANDFMCFLGRFAMGDPRANCDHSTTLPILNANDFLCFLNEFSNCH